MFNNLKAANYRVFINDANSCGGNSVAVVIAQTSPSCFPVATLARNATNKPESAKTSFDISLSPNPSRSQFLLQVHSPKQDEVTIRVLDVNGKIVYAAKGLNHQSIRFGETFAPGMYMIEVRQGDEVKTLKAVKIN